MSYNSQITTAISQGLIYKYGGLWFWDWVNDEVGNNFHKKMTRIFFPGKKYREYRTTSAAALNSIIETLIQITYFTTLTEAARIIALETLSNLDEEGVKDEAKEQIKTFLNGLTLSNKERYLKNLENANIFTLQFAIKALGPLSIYKTDKPWSKETRKISIQTNLQTNLLPMRRLKY